MLNNAVDVALPEPQVYFKTGTGRPSLGYVDDMDVCCQEMAIVNEQITCNFLKYQALKRGS